MRSLVHCAPVILGVAMLAGPASVLPGFAAPGDNAVVHWNEVALNTITTNETSASIRSAP